MNRASSEMLRCLNTPGNLAGNGTEVIVLERQQAHIKWQQEHHHHHLEQQPVEQQQLQYFDGNDQFGSVFAATPAQAEQFQRLIGGEDTGLHEVVNRAVKADPGLDQGWFAGEGSGIGSGFQMNYGISRTTSCPPAVTAAVAMAETKQREPASPEKTSKTAGRESFKKRKADHKNQNLKAIAEEEYSEEKRIKACAEDGESKITEQNSNNDGKNNDNNNNKRETSSADASKVSEIQKPDYIHVRARRGQATDSHSLAERVRREKISERMKYLQDLVPGCNKITGKAGMLDEIINYVQSLQRQVEFLSMKLAAVNPTFDFNIDSFFSKEVFPVGLTSDITNPAYLQFNPMQQAVTCNGLEMGLNVPDAALRRVTSAPISIPETLPDSSCFNHVQPSSVWNANLQSLYGVELLQGRSTPFPTQQFTGSNEDS